MQEVGFDWQGLSTKVELKRAQKRMSLKKVSQLVGVSERSLYRLREGGALEVQSLILVLEWLDVPFEFFVWPGKEVRRETLVQNFLKDKTPLERLVMAIDKEKGLSEGVRKLLGQVVGAILGVLK